MIRSFDGVDETQIYNYAGLFISIFTFCEFLSSIVWAWVSDRIGRKKTLLIRSICGIILALTFGVSKSMALAIASGAFGGLCNPDVDLFQTCVAKFVGQKEHQGRFFRTRIAYLG